MGEEIVLKDLYHGKVEKRRRVLLVDDHAMLRQGLALLLSLELDLDAVELEIVGEACDGVQGVTLTRELRPDVVVLDFSMPRMNGIEAARIIRSEFPEIRIVALSMDGQEDRAQAMLDAGADTYVKKTCEAGTLLAAIRG